MALPEGKSVLAEAMTEALETQKATNFQTDRKLTRLSERKVCCLSHNFYPRRN